ncbi:hypothetical protein CYMTET_5150 [Cymbomonas tetramitiformis]|uniref:Uncharacterized protein n=1 Tax=Cymbomonas tetramitiformis TaxID=36881 RepID=A0AAE0GZQ0_9CHLO|nr:hypothetical protein CYMTET_5150 [Cymbomonas tetramitiformis]
MDDSSDGEEIPPPEPASQVSVVPRHPPGGGSSLPLVCRAAVLPAVVSALMCIRAAAAATPTTDQVFGGVLLDTTAGPGRTVGGVVSDYIVPEEFPSTPWTPSIDTATLPTTISGSATHGFFNSWTSLIFFYA